MRRVLCLLLVLAASTASPVVACPYCQTEIGQAVRAEVFNSQFATNALATLLPLIVLAAVVTEIRFGLLFPTTTANNPTTESR